MDTTKKSLHLRGGWVLVETEDGAIWLNETPDVSKGNGIYIGQDTAAAVKALEEVVDILQGPPTWSEGFASNH